MDDLRICIVGAGAHSTNRIYPYIAPAAALLVGVCDLDMEKARINARRFGGNAYVNMRAMLGAEKPDGVIICIGPDEHAALAPIAMQMGIPVYTEKPPATTAADTLAVARMSEKTGVLCMTAFKKRYSRVYQHAREWIGKYPSADRYALAVNYASAHYFNDTGRNSYLLDFAIHLIDLMGYLFGDVDKVFCFAKGYDAYAVSLRFACGAVGTMDLNDGRAWAVPTEEVEITLRGGNFMSIHNSSQWCITEDGEPSAWREPATFVSSGGSGADTGHLTEIVDFLAAIREGRSTRSHVRESYKSMVLYEGIAESARTGKVVTLKYEA